ncbi:MAG: CHRD domain-containing protein [Dehalococcoidia bacterium]
MTLTRTLNPPTSIALGLLAAGLVALALLFAPGRGSAQAPQTVNIAQLTLSGANEVPPVTANTTGFFSGSVTANSMTFDLSANGAGLTMAHIHLGAAGTNGPIVAFLFGPEAAGVPAIHPTGTLTATNLIGPIAGDWAAFAAALAAGNLYANVHSIDNPAGVGRAQIPATSAPAASPTAAPPGPPATGTGIADEGTLSGAALGGIILIVVATSVGAVHVSRRRA